MNLDFTKGNGLIPAVVQDAKTQKVLMLGYMNEESLRVTQEKGLVTFYSRSRQSLWTKGETSGNFLKLVELIPDCDQDAILVKAQPQGPTCHTGEDTCFKETNEAFFLDQLEEIIHNYKNNPREGSYTSALFKKGINKIAQKVGEEAVELVIEAKDDNDDLFKNEAADLLYHLIVLLTERGFSYRDIVAVLEERHQNKK